MPVKRQLRDKYARIHLNIVPSIKFLIRPTFIFIIVSGALLIKVARERHETCAALFPCSQVESQSYGAQ